MMRVAPLTPFGIWRATWYTTYSVEWQRHAEGGGATERTVLPLEYFYMRGDTRSTASSSGVPLVGQNVSELSASFVIGHIHREAA
jgi:hypothetical protein